MAAPMSTNVDLGFVHENDRKWQLFSHFFPSKIGGKPSWLSINPIPGVNDVSCKICNKPCIFLLQVYAPLEDKQSCFHRTLFLFICRDVKCNASNKNDNLIVLRSQLPRKNDFYDYEPPDLTKCPSGDIPKADKFQEVCVTCGCVGPKKCAKCHKASYCCREHQLSDWKSGHKQACGQENANANGNPRVTSKLLFPEFELEIEKEESMDTEEDVDKSEATKMKEYQDFVKSAKAEGTLLGDKDQTDLEKMATGEDTVDEQFVKFKEKTEQEPEQVLRYQRGGQPLWVATVGQPEEGDLPPCSCGAQRQFEFQVMPQLLNHLGVDSVGESLDWGTLAVYTCVDSCQSQAYHTEFVWKQDFTNDKPPTDNS